VGPPAPARLLVSEPGGAGGPPSGEPADACAREPAPAALLELAIEAATGAGALLAERARAGAERSVSAKSTPTDLVSAADLASERAIRELISARRPHDGFLGEEGDHVQGSSGLSWVVDPLDGTVNFLFGIPQWSVSVAVRDAQRTLAGAVYDPNRHELFTATADGPAQLAGPAGTVALAGRAGGDALGGGTGGTGGARAAGEGADAGVTGAAGDPDLLAAAMVATGFAYDARVRAAQGEVLARLLPRVRDVRRFGSAALDLAWTAAGRYDAYFERTVKAWDVAAGVLVCERAGLRVLELREREHLPWGVLAAPAGLAEQLAGLVDGW